MHNRTFLSPVLSPFYKKYRFYSFFSGRKSLQILPRFYADGRPIYPANRRAPFQKRPVFSFGDGYTLWQTSGERRINAFAPDRGQRDRGGEQKTEEDFSARLMALASPLRNILTGGRTKTILETKRRNRLRRSFKRERRAGSSMPVQRVVCCAQNCAFCKRCKELNKNNGRRTN